MANRVRNGVIAVAAGIGTYFVITNPPSEASLSKTNIAELAPIRNLYEELGELSVAEAYTQAQIHGLQDNASEMLDFSPINSTVLDKERIVQDLDRIITTDISVTTGEEIREDILGLRGRVNSLYTKEKRFDENIISGVMAIYGVTSFVLGGITLNGGYRTIFPKKPKATE